MSIVVALILDFRLLGYGPFDDMVSVPRVDAEAKIKPDKGKLDKPVEKKEEADEDSSDSEGESEDGEKKAKRPKEKVGFRDRKVNY